MGSKFPSASFFFANVTLSLKASLISSLGWPSRQSVFSLTGEHSFSFYCYKFVSESLKGSHLVSRLRTAFGSDNGYAAWPMCNAHSGFSLVPVLSAGTASASEFDIAVTCEGFKIGTWWLLTPVHGGCLVLLLYAPAMRRKTVCKIPPLR
tara:strand:- start:14 stop:463 length:450 start_codon:yes stop_codon:yes gene_type:complete